MPPLRWLNYLKSPIFFAFLHPGNVSNGLALKNEQLNISFECGPF